MELPGAVNRVGKSLFEVRGSVCGVGSVVGWGSLSVCHGSLCLAGREGVVKASVRRLLLGVSAAAMT